MRGNFEEYIEKCKIVHNNKYDYSKAIEPRTTSDNITIICPIHGEFQQPLKNHLEGKGCKKCARIKQNVNLLSEIQKKEIINKANSEDDKIIYNKIESVNRSYKIFGMCNHINKKGNIHGAFSVSLSHYKRGSRCPKCGYERLSCTTEEVIDKCKKTDFGKDLIYDKFIYYRSSIKSIFTCPIHGDFEMTPNNLLAGHICKECAKLNRISKRTKTTEQFIDECIKKYGTDRYGFWRVNYKGNSELVEIWCYNCHSYFKILPYMKFYENL